MTILSAVPTFPARFDRMPASSRPCITLSLLRAILSPYRLARFCSSSFCLRAIAISSRRSRLFSDLSASCCFALLSFSTKNLSTASAFCLRKGIGLILVPLVLRCRLFEWARCTSSGFVVTTSSRAHVSNSAAMLATCFTLYRCWDRKYNLGDRSRNSGWSRMASGLSSIRSTISTASRNSAARPRSVVRTSVSSSPTRSKTSRQNEPLCSTAKSSEGLLDMPSKLIGVWKRPSPRSIWS
mmetsp:Transcript_13863/g.39457  ORF Transcript_13863/g.39457 Transcript_13863/m.39457 type:complete len:240 (-) Transcript_13863:714-1433(-)